MKKVLALSLLFAIVGATVSAQNAPAERIQRHRIEQRLEGRGAAVNHPHMMQRHRQMMIDRSVKHRIMKHRAIKQRMLHKRRPVQMQQRRNMMRHRRVI